ncbi:GNAT family N-acetyltransferase [Kitasatospora sp. NPDC017646]|uniref:GNAT family N-acetyltransferase n=1 Tax=Kitasatospora sp. NPDC017646 TaxID=3364024 RepID=UPI00378775E8
MPVADKLLSRLDPQQSRLLTAQVDGVLAGWVILNRDPYRLVGHWGTIHHLQTHPAFRGRGIGSALVHELRKIATLGRALGHVGPDQGEQPGGEAVEMQLRRRCGRGAAKTGTVVGGGTTATGQAARCGTSPAAEPSGNRVSAARWWDLWLGCCWGPSRLWIVDEAAPFWKGPAITPMVCAEAAAGVRPRRGRCRSGAGRG